MVFISVYSLGIGGVGKTTISYALAKSLSYYDLTLLITSSQLHNLLNSGSVNDIYNISIFNNLVIAGFSNDVVSSINQKHIIRVIDLVNIISQKVREPKYIVLDLPTHLDYSSLEKSDAIILITRPSAYVLSKIYSNRLYGSIKIGKRVVPVFLIINFFPSKLNVKSKKVREVLGIDLIHYDAIIPEFEKIPKTDSSILKVANEIIKRKYLTKLVNTIRELFS